MPAGRAKCLICGVDYIAGSTLEIVHEYAPPEPRCEPCSMHVHVMAFRLVRTKLTPTRKPGLWERLRNAVARSCADDA